MTKTNYTQSARTWTKELVIAAIQANTRDGYCKSTDVGMVVTSTAKRLFGSFGAALDASGAKLWSSRPRLTECSIPGCVSSVRSARSDYCEVHYYRLRRNGTIATITDTAHYDDCVYCGAKSDGRKYCDPQCRSRHAYGLPVTKSCVICGKEFKPFNKTATCSGECDRELVRMTGRAWYARAMQTPEHRLKVRRAEYQCKALKKNAFVEHVDLHVVYKRDKGICWLCSKKVDIALKWPDTGFATLDHVVPLAAGGMHSYGNIKLAHLACNCKKGARKVVGASMGGTPVPERGQALLF